MSCFEWGSAAKGNEIEEDIGLDQIEGGDVGLLC